MKMSYSLSRVQSVEWRYKMAAISTHMVFQAMGLDDIALFKPSFPSVPRC